MPSFSHLHVHSQYSLLDGASKIPALYEKARQDNMPGLALTDHGNMFGVFQFVAEAWGKNNMNADGTHKVKPVIGCEFYLVEDRHKKTFSREDKDVRFHQLLLAKNETGYKNLTKLCSLGYLDGLYGKYPRIDKELILQYHEGLIATSCCLAAEIPRTILRKGKEAAEELLKWWLDVFGEDFYIELQRHGIEDQETVNVVLLEFAKKYNVKIIASNDSHYVEQDDALPHEILLCINTGAKMSDPKFKDYGDEGAATSKGRFAFANDQFFFKTQSQMLEVFSDIPEALDNTNEIVDKITPLNLQKDILLPDFPIPEEFKKHSKPEVYGDKTLKPEDINQWEYLKHLTYEGAKERYGEIKPEVQERIDFELHTIKIMGFAGYFLIVSDFINYGKENNVIVGPGRGSAAGSVVAYCIGITNIDPIKYDLLFERFLNPDRASMPDIDTDFDDEGREKVLQYVAEKYGREKVAHIITYGTMASKSSIKDVARVMDLDLQTSNYLTKLIPERPGIAFKEIFDMTLSGKDSLVEKLNLNQEEESNIKKLRELIGQDTEIGKVLKMARKLEGSVRNTGIHAAGVIIAPKDISEILPVCVSKDASLNVTQFEGSIIEDAGVIKMDFLGLKTLSIIRDAVILIKKKHNVTIDIDDVPLDDEKTLQLYRDGKTIGTFQFESPGMQKYLRELKPDKFELLIAMNALYRPGPMDYIESFIKRRHGQEEIVYDLDAAKDVLEETFGITVYQEQVMLLSQKLAGFTKGQADNLRKAMGKKKRDVIDKLKPAFLEGCEKNGHEREKCEKIWKDWEAFASYAFNKSHSTCYAYVAYQTGYLKAHYPAEYMATILSHNLSNMDKMKHFMDEAKSMGILVLGPDINESDVKFSVNAEGNIRFGLSAISGVGSSVAQEIIEEREANGFYEDAFDLASRIPAKYLNKRVIEGLAKAGAFDFDKRYTRPQYYVSNDNSQTGSELIHKFGVSANESKNSSQASLFGGSTLEEDVMKPKLPDVADYPLYQLLEDERKMVGLFLSSHPLDLFDLVFENYDFEPVSRLSRLDSFQNGQRFYCGFYVTAARTLMGKNNKPFLIAEVQDKNGSVDLRLFDNDFLHYQNHFTVGSAIYAEIEVKHRANPGSDRVYYNMNYLKVGSLDDFAKKAFKKLSVRVHDNQINQDNLSHFINVVKKHKGNCPIDINFITKKYYVNTHVSKYKVEINKDLLNEISKLDLHTELVK
jgi:DNA polymerase III subunit alpha